MFDITLMTFIMYCFSKLFYESIFVGCFFHDKYSNITGDISTGLCP